MDLQRIRTELADADSLGHFLWGETREGMAFVAPDGVMHVVNPSFANLLGYSVGELEGRPFADITIGQDIDPDLAEFSKLLRGEIREYTMVKSYTSKARRTVTCKLRAVNIQTGVLVLGQILPVDTLALEQLPPHEANRVVKMLLGTVLFDNWKKVLLALGALLGVARIDHLLAILQ